MRATINTFKSISFTENKIELHFIDLEDYTLELMEYINHHFVTICEGDSGSDIETVKQRARDFFENKSDEIKMGAIAEFFIHLYLKKQGFKQECTFFNLEEGSIKKGFDGYYSKGEAEWIMESKAGRKESQNSSHWNKIKTAYNDLTDKFRGAVKNNPWKNAYNHASLIDVGTHNSIRKNIKMLSDNFTKRIFPSINDFNIIPASTIFLNGQWEDYNIDELKTNILDKVSKLNFKTMIIICVTKKSIDLFLDFLRA
ncbi:hypothetical protein NRS6084_03781 [Bacillus subtilis]|uniref:hypothetical protein n=1 Tax=Bacillus subtilis TaxID=1423 RepID=UPI0009539C29|nr:hypothetical protein [Bacillus subtilis]MEC0600577.1 hypothetical protein [Bacillus spizizenii]CAF1770729.1 hypothetical protein NRS6084_03781 [Bacillus subtilis]SIR43807.1 hypothetical protein SAMN05878487_3847 [Bacillus subtilis]